MSATIVIDMRCLQDPQHAERGIATHARNTILRARQSSAMARTARMIGLIDPDLEALPPAVAAVADEIRPNGYCPDLPAGAIFLNPSPMTYDQTRNGRLLLDPKLRKAVLVYDFIPFDDQFRYLTRLPQRLDYFTSIAWLNRYDLFLPISEDTGARLAALFTLRGRKAAVTGVPLPTWLEAEAGPPETPRHILAVAGDDPRKNPEVLIRAHAASQVLQVLRIPLIISGNYPPARLVEFRTLAAAHGGMPELVHAPGRLPQEVMASNYRAAFCVVTPSRAEGFSMPVIEAMAAGVPSLASDIAAHAALVTDPALRFDPDDHERLRALLERCVTDLAFRAGIVAAQAAMGQKFRSATVAETIWAAIAALAPLPNAAPIGRKPRIALLTLLPPAKSGIADFSVRLEKSFGGLAAPEMFSAGLAPGAKAASALPCMAARYDRVVGIIGNSPQHNVTLDLLMEYGGACICHDSRLFGLMLSRAGIEGAARMASRELGRYVTETEIAAWIADENLREADFLEGLSHAARPLIFHTRHTAAAVTARFGRTARFLPFALYRDWDDQTVTTAARMAARDRLGISTQDCVIASFGFITATKGIDAALRSLSLLQRRGFTCRLFWVGQRHQDITAFETLADTLGIASSVCFIDRFLSEAAYRDYLLAADFGLQLRLGKRGKISGALADCIAAGLPTVASNDLAENIDAPSFVARVADTPDPAEIADAFMQLFDTRRDKLDWEDERRDYVAAHSMTRYARGLCDILEL